jgi:hypothetical protein
MVKVKFISLKKADDGKYKYVVSLLNEETGRTNNIKFGAFGMNDFTITGDVSAKQRYEARHSSREDWTKNGVLTKGFWAKRILWNKPTVDASLKETIRAFSL